MDRVSAAFHKNVSLLVKSVPPNNDFKKHFQMGMFDKPNTTGFIHMSYYLLSIYYKDNLKSKVSWPVICKQTENQFRNDTKKCLIEIASENPDLNFPSILSSHLILAGGTKFILIMWKFSLAVLRTHLKREHNSVVMYAPKPGPCQEVAMSYLKKVTTKNETEILDIRKSRENVEQQAQSYLSKITGKQNEIKERILKLMEYLKKVVEVAPANETAKKRLLDIEDHNIIELWTHCIIDRLQINEKDCQLLEEVDNELKYINNIVYNIKGNLQIFNAHNIDKIKTEPIYKLIPLEKQVFLYGLYNEDNFLNIHNFFSILNVLIKKCDTEFIKNNLDEISVCNEQLEASNHVLKNALGNFQMLHEQILNFYNNELKNNQKVNESVGSLANAPEYAKVLFMPSPSFNINVNNNEEKSTVSHKDLKLTPAESAHKDLFSKYARSNKKGTNFINKKFPVMKIIFDEEANESNSFKQTQFQSRQFQTPPKYKHTFKNVAKYSRIFSTIRPNYNRVNNSMMTMMSNDSMLPPVLPKDNISLIDSCNSSQEFSQEPLLLNPNLNSTIEPTKVPEKAPPKTQKRRSISDLVERYKSIVQKRDNN